MGTLGKFLAAVCAILFIVSSVLVLLVFNIEQKAFSSATYKQAFENQRLYERMPAILATALTTSMAENINAVPFLKAMTVEDWQNSISMLLPPEELGAMADNALDATFDYLNGKTNSAVISLLPVKARLAGEGGINVVIQVLRLQPPYTPEQLTQMALGLLGGEIALCDPPEQAIGLMAPFIQSQLQVMTAIFPNEVTFIAGATSGTPADPRLKLNAVRSAIKLTPFLPVLFLFGIAVFAVRSLAGWLAWWGWSFTIAGLSSLLIGLVGSPLVGWILQLLIQNQGTILIPPVLASSIAETTSAVAREMLAPVMIEGAVLAIVGLIMALIAVFLAKRERDHLIRRMSVRGSS